jgi:AraC-like DNA-binding protein
MAYLKRWRLQVGATLLRQQTLALSSIVERVGYESTAAFSRAFTREFGVRPASSGVGQACLRRFFPAEMYEQGVRRTFSLDTPQ